MARTQRIPDCHPDREHEAKGLCRPCYHRQRYTENPIERDKQKKRNAQWHKDNPDIRRKRTLKNKYNLTLAEYGRILELQKGVCAICKQGFSTTPHVDHDHETGLVRGLVHRSCNLMIGYAHDDPTILQGGIVYLQNGSYTPQGYPST